MTCDYYFFDSALSTQHSLLSTRYSALSTQHSALSTQHSLLSTLHSLGDSGLFWQMRILSHRLGIL
ncbi:MAG: hypothetical protein RMY16_23725 [Nostoc sp. DedQUE12b]|nr:hypothetical protein [Nostoc sp. DedQUE12b]